MGRRLIVLSVLLASPAAVAQTPPAVPEPKVAIVPGIAVNLDTARVDALSQDLAQALSTELAVDAVGGLEVRRLLPADGVPPDCVTTPACITDVAQRTGAAQLLFVVMVDSGSGGTIQVDTTWVDPASGASASRPAIDLASPADAKSKFATAAPQLLPDAPRRAKPASGGGGGVTPTMTEGVPRHFTTPAKITAAVGAVGLGAGIAFGLSARSKYRACEADLVACTQEKRDSISNVALVADIGFVVALGGAIATTVLYVTSSEEPRLVVTPTEGGGASVLAIGRF